MRDIRGIGSAARAALNTANLSTPLGLALAAAARTPLRRGPGGLFIAEHYRPRLPAAAAFVVGNVVFTRGRAEDLLARPALFGHEARHATQYAACLGLPFLPLYAVAAAYSAARTGNPGSLNPFEQIAGLEAGGYPRRRTRPLPPPASTPAGSHRHGVRKP
ncbi:hypothetical protein ABCQ75_15600 [Sinomonas halotolerans]|uniref:DUF4157 domain-containing protein n=2 Tax=Sinomonas halotolerans TaxID=1644133 RepID=A0ABU9X3B5_9MICC